MSLHIIEAKEGLVDLRAHKLWGWEDNQLPQRVGEYMDAIERGNDIAPVPIRLTIGGLYLSPKIMRPDGTKIDGGHHRSIAHYLSDVPLPVEIVGLSPVPPLWYRRRLPIEQLAQRCLQDLYRHD